jgi:hypothetical protein
MNSITTRAIRRSQKTNSTKPNISKNNSRNWPALTMTSAKRFQQIGVVSLPVAVPAYSALRYW